MDLRVELIRAHDAGESITALAEIYQVSRKTIYKWLKRYEAAGAAGLADRSRAPHERPQQVSEEMVKEIIEARHRWKWGPRKLRLKLMEQQPDLVWPAASTLGEILKRAGLSHRRVRKHRTPLYGSPFANIEEANQTWCADFKGWFRTGDGVRCDPLTITDAHSRYLLCCQITAKADTVHVQALFEETFRQYGLPRVIRTDNGPPFASPAPGGLSRLSMWWIKLGILPERTRPASPQENGRHERMHLTLKQDTLRPPACNRRRQQEVFDRFRQVYNDERPHEALQDKTPTSQYEPSPRQMPRRVPELEYAPDLIVRRVSTRGEFRWGGAKVFVSELLNYEAVGLKPHDDRFYEVFYGPVRIGWLDSHRRHFHRKLCKRLKAEMGSSEE